MVLALCVYTHYKQTLTNWKNSWVHHPLRTERNKSQLQLWIRGLQAAHSSQTTEDVFFQVIICKK